MTTMLLLSVLALAGLLAFALARLLPEPGHREERIPVEVRHRLPRSGK